MRTVGEELNVSVIDKSVADRDRWIGATNIDEDRWRERRRVERAIPLPAFAGTVSVHWNSMTTLTAGTMPRNIVLFDEMKLYHARIIWWERQDSNPQYA